MSRLTKKVGDNYCSQNGDFYDLYNKLGKLEDLEEQIGCPLEVYMQIEMNRVNGLYDEKGDFWKFDYVTHTHFRCYRKNGKDEENKFFAVSDYKKTWWLKENREE